MIIGRAFNHADIFLNICNICTFSCTVSVTGFWGKLPLILSVQQHKAPAPRSRFLHLNEVIMSQQEVLENLACGAKKKVEGRELSGTIEDIFCLPRQSSPCCQLDRSLNSSNRKPHSSLSNLSTVSALLLRHPSSSLPSALSLSLPVGRTDLVMRAPCALPVPCPMVQWGPVGQEPDLPRPTLLIILITSPQISAGQAAGSCPQLIKVPAR